MLTFETQSTIVGSATGRDNIEEKEYDKEITLHGKSVLNTASVNYDDDEPIDFPTSNPETAIKEKGLFWQKTKSYFSTEISIYQSEDIFFNVTEIYQDETLDFRKEFKKWDEDREIKSSSNKTFIFCNEDRDLAVSIYLDEYAFKTVWDLANRWLINPNLKLLVETAPFFLFSETKRTLTGIPTLNSFLNNEPYLTFGPTITLSNQLQK